MMINKITPSVDYNYGSKVLTLLEQIYPNSIKVPKVFEPTNKIT